MRGLIFASGESDDPGSPSERLESARGRISANPSGRCEPAELLYLSSVGDMYCDELAVVPAAVGE